MTTTPKHIVSNTKRFSSACASLLETCAQNRNADRLPQLHAYLRRDREMCRKTSERIYARGSEGRADRCPSIVDRRGVSGVSFRSAADRRGFDRLRDTGGSVSFAFSSIISLFLYFCFFRLLAVRPRNNGVRPARDPKSRARKVEYKLTGAAR